MYLNTQVNDMITGMIQRVAARLITMRGGRQRLTILIFHRVLPSEDPYLKGTVDAIQFSKILAVLKDVFNVMPLDKAIEYLARDALQPGSVCLTFDDGYADNVEVALPILQEYGLTATFFIATGFLNGDVMWNDSVFDIMRRAPGQILDLTALGMKCCDLTSVESRYLSAVNVVTELKYLPLPERDDRVIRIRDIAGLEPPEPLMMDVEQLKKLHHAGMQIGAHTVSHPILARLNDEEAYHEITMSRRHLEDILESPVKCFAYPNGKPGVDYTSRDVALVKSAGFSYALSTAWGVATKDCDFYQLPRFTPWDKTRNRFVMRLLANNMRTQSKIDKC